MLGNIQKISNATEKFGDWAEKVSAAKAAIFDKSGKIDNELDFKFTRPLYNGIRTRETSQVDPVEALQNITDGRVHFLNTYFKEKILNAWEVQGEEGPSDDFSDLITAEEPKTAEPIAPPLLLGFEDTRDYVEVEYMVVGDPDTGDYITPEISVSPSTDGKSGDIFLNGKLVACVAGGKNLQVEDVKLIKVEV
ncbi:MAG: hypothetical protein QM492_05705 [Rhodobacterales bacterium]